MDKDSIHLTAHNLEFYTEINLTPKQLTLAVEQFIKSQLGSQFNVQSVRWNMDQHPDDCDVLYMSGATVNLKTKKV